MTKIYSIYGLIDPIGNKIFYIGKTSRAPSERYAEHIKETSGVTPKQKKIQEIYKAKGLPPDLVILEGGINDSKLAFTREVYWMEIFRMTGTVLTNASVDYDGVYFLTDDHLATVRKIGRWSVDVSEPSWGGKANLTDDGVGLEQIQFKGKKAIPPDDVAEQQLDDFKSIGTHLTCNEIESEQMKINSTESIASCDRERPQGVIDPLQAKTGRVIGDLMAGLESGRWQGGDAILAATKMKEHFEEKGRWLPSYNGSNKLKKKRHKWTLKIIGFLKQSEK